MNLCITDHLIIFENQNFAFEILEHSLRELLKKQHDSILNSPCVKEETENTMLQGYMLKRGGLNTGFKKRFFQQVIQRFFLKNWMFFRKEEDYIILTLKKMENLKDLLVYPQLMMWKKLDPPLLN